LKDVLPCLLAFIGCRFIFDHGQIIGAAKEEVKTFLNVVNLLAVIAAQGIRLV
jgi:hypothetical protein